MEWISLPVYIMFFTLAGARLDIGALAVAWGTALVIAGSRIIMLVIGTRLATRLAGDPPRFQGNCWLGFVTQAGLSLALVAQIESNYPGWGASLATVLVAVITINQMVGPLAFKIALERVGEAKGTAARKRED
jgi:Kef-type K+ transport system membrane component KefB